MHWIAPSERDTATETLKNACGVRPTSFVRIQRVGRNPIAPDVMSKLCGHPFLSATLASVHSRGLANCVNFVQIFLVTIYVLQVSIQQIFFIMLSHDGKKFIC